MHGTCGERRKKKDGEEKNNNRKEQIVHDQITMTMSTRYAVRYTHGHDHTLLYYRRFLRRPFSSLHTLAADNILLIFFCLSSFFVFISAVVGCQQIAGRWHSLWWSSFGNTNYVSISGWSKIEIKKQQQTSEMRERKKTIERWNKFSA